MTLGFERSVQDAAARGADVLTYLTPRSNWLYGAVPFKFPVPETTLFLGFVALFLVGLGLLWARDRPEPSSMVDRLLAGGMWACLAFGGLALAARGRASAELPPRPALVTLAGLGLLTLVLARLTLDGWRRRRQAAVASPFRGAGLGRPPAGAGRVRDPALARANGLRVGPAGRRGTRRVAL